MKNLLYLSLSNIVISILSLQLCHAGEGFKFFGDGLVSPVHTIGHQNSSMPLQQVQSIEENKYPEPDQILFDDKKPIDAESIDNPYITKFSEWVRIGKSVSEFYIKNPDILTFFDENNLNHFVHTIEKNKEVTGTTVVIKQWQYINKKLLQRFECVREWTLCTENKDALSTFNMTYKHTMCIKDFIQDRTYNQSVSLFDVNQVTDKKTYYFGLFHKDPSKPFVDFGAWYGQSAGSKTTGILSVSFADEKDY